MLTYSYFQKKITASALILRVALHKYIPSIIKNNYITFHSRPKKSINISTSTFKDEKQDELAIVIQGPIINKDEFTVESINLYKKIFPDALIILSTWQNSNKNTLDHIDSLGIKVLLNEKPSDPGFFNVNMQLITTLEGIKYAKAYGSKYILKTRTDQRIHRHDLFCFFKNLQRLFPPIDGWQLQRLIISSFGTCKYRLYGVTDFFMFGCVEDMIKYWSAPPFSIGIGRISSECDSSDKIPIVSGVPVAGEIYIMVNYLIRINQKLEWTLDHYWKMLKQYFIVIDGIAIDIYWNKYFRMNEYRYTRDYAEPNPRAMEFADWLHLYMNGDGPWLDIRKPEFWKYEKGSLLIEKL